MKRAATILVLLSVISITLFGFSTLHADDGEHGARCLASAFTATEPPCPQTDAIGFVGYHLDAFKTFSLATLVGVILVFVTLVLWSIPPGQPLVPVFAFIGHIPSLPQQFRSASEWRWYSLHENSPSAL